MIYCENCGTQILESAKFCPSCGAKNEPPPAVYETQPQYQQTDVYDTQPQYQQPAAVYDTQPQYQQPAQPQYQPPPQPQYQQPYAQPVYPPAKKKSGGFAAAVILIVVLLIGGGGFGLYYFIIRDSDFFGNLTAVNTPTPTVTQKSENNETQTGLPDVSYSYMDKKPEAIIEFTTVDSVFPSNYRSMDALAVFTGYSDYGELDVLIEVEVPGFTQPYRQMVTLGRKVTKLRIVPPLVTGTLDLNSEKTAQIVYSVKEVESGRLLVQESKNIKLYSLFDMIWGDAENGDAYTDNILAWMTPDAPEIAILKRDAIDYLSFISEGALDGLYGYQDYHFFDHYYYNTWVQAVAIQGAMSDITQVRYNHSGFSMDAQQRVKLPAETISTRSGICIETTLVMASALQSAGMHCMLIFPPGHAQVAVEAWPQSGDYFLIETTVLPMDADMDTWNYVVQYLSQDEWWGYLSGEGDYTYGPCYVVDCDLGAKLGIRAISN